MVGKKYIFKQNWVDKSIYASDLFDASGLLFSYERFFLVKSFPVISREFNYVMKAIPNGIFHLMKSHLQFQEAQRIETLLMINGNDIMNAKCNNENTRNAFNERGGKAIWGNILEGIDWQRGWLLPYTFKK